MNDQIKSDARQILLWLIIFIISFSYFIVSFMFMVFGPTLGSLIAAVGINWTISKYYINPALTRWVHRNMPK